MALPRWTASRCLLEDVVRGSRTGIAVCVVALLVSLELHAAEKEYVVKGMVLSVDASAKTFVVSHERIVGLMEAMTMPFEVRQAGDLRDVVPGAIVEFTLVVGDTTSYARSVVVRRYQTIERDPSTARRLATMKRMAGLATREITIVEIEVSYERTIEQRRPIGRASSAADKGARAIEREAGYVPQNTVHGVLADCANCAGHCIENTDLER